MESHYHRLFLADTFKFRNFGFMFLARAVWSLEVGRFRDMLGIVNPPSGIECVFVVSTPDDACYQCHCILNVTLTLWSVRLFIHLIHNYATDTGTHLPSNSKNLSPLIIHTSCPKFVFQIDRNFPLFQTKFNLLFYLALSNFTSYFILINLISNS